MRLGVHDALDDAEQVKGAAREPVNPRYRHHVAGRQLAEHPQKLTPVGPGARHLLSVDVAAAASGGAKLLKLAVEGLPVGADPGIADEPFFRMIFGHILCKLYPIDPAGSSEMHESLRGQFGREELGTGVWDACRLHGGDDIGPVVQGLSSAHFGESYGRSN